MGIMVSFDPFLQGKASFLLVHWTVFSHCLDQAWLAASPDGASPPCSGFLLGCLPVVLQDTFFSTTSLRNLLWFLTAPIRQQRFPTAPILLSPESVCLTQPRAEHVNLKLLPVIPSDEILSWANPHELGQLGRDPRALARIFLPF
jgi:hypothetical protein